MTSNGNCVRPHNVPRSLMAILLGLTPSGLYHSSDLRLHVRARQLRTVSAQCVTRCRALRDELIASPVYRLDELRMMRIALDLLPEPCDRKVDGSRSRLVGRRTPHVGQ